MCFEYVNSFLFVQVNTQYYYLINKPFVFLVIKFLLKYLAEQLWFLNFMNEFSISRFIYHSLSSIIIDNEMFSIQWIFLSQLFFIRMIWLHQICLKEWLKVLTKKILILECYHFRVLEFISKSTDIIFISSFSYLRVHTTSFLSLSNSFKYPCLLISKLHTHSQ